MARSIASKLLLLIPVVFLVSVATFMMTELLPGDPAVAILGENARILSDAASGIVVSQTRRVISLIGVRDIVVVDTEDALLVTTSEHAQRVKGVVDALKLSGRGEVL